MITLHQIQRLADHGAFDQLIDVVLRNGRDLPLAARHRLSDPDWAEPAALGLGLVRLCELVHIPNRSVRVMAERLVGRQREGGGWGEGLSGIAATAAAVAGLEAVETLAGRRPGAVGERLARRIAAAIDAGVHWLSTRQGAALQPALFEPGIDSADEETPDRSLLGGVLDSALVLWLLGDSARFAAAARVRDLAAAAAAEARSDADVRAVLTLAGAGVGGRWERPGAALAA